MTFCGTKSEIQQFIFKNLDKDKKYDLKIEPYHEKRSLKANAYAWELITEIANALRLSKEEIYLEMLKAYGQREYWLGDKNAKPETQFKYFEKQGIIKRKENVYYSYLVYIGTSKYNSREMAIFIDGLVQEARNLDIPTLEDKEIEKLIEEMKIYE